MIYPFFVLQDRFPETLVKWFDSMNKLRPVYEVFFSMFRSSRMYLQSQFLHLSQAVESFHRRTVGGLYLREDQYEAVKSVVIAAIPPTLDTGLRARLKSQIKYANEPSLRRRLTGILEGLSERELSMICQNSGEFIGAIVDTRNYLTHLDESSGEDILEDQQLLHAGQKLELLLTILLLKHLGLPEDEALTRIERTGKFNTMPFALNKEASGTQP
jgi:hypothetical protein